MKYSFDAENRLSEVVSSGERAVCTHGPNGRLGEHANDAVGLIEKHNCNAANLPVSQEIICGGEILYASNLEYDLSCRLIERAEPDPSHYGRKLCVQGWPWMAEHNPDNGQIEHRGFVLARQTESARSRSA